MFNACKEKLLVISAPTPLLIKLTFFDDIYECQLSDQANFKGKPASEALASDASAWVMDLGKQLTTLVIKIISAHKHPT